MPRASQTTPTIRLLHALSEEINDANHDFPIAVVCCHRQRHLSTVRPTAQWERHLKGDPADGGVEKVP